MPTASVGAPPRNSGVDPEGVQKPSHGQCSEVRVMPQGGSSVIRGSEISSNARLNTQGAAQRDPSSIRTEPDVAIGRDPETQAGPKAPNRTIASGYCLIAHLSLENEAGPKVLGSAAWSLKGPGCRRVRNTVRFSFSQESPNFIPARFPCVGPREPRNHINIHREAESGRFR